MDMDEERTIIKDTIKTYNRKERDQEKGKGKNVIEEKTKVKKVKTSLLETGESLRIRMSPKSLYSIIPKLSEEQRKAVTEIGFKSLLGLSLSECHR